MGFSCMKDVYERTPYLQVRENYYYCTRHWLHHPQESQQARLKNAWKRKKRWSDPIRCLAVRKLARSVFAHKNNFSARYLVVHLSPQTLLWNYMQLRSAHSFVYILCGRINGSIKIMVLQIALHTKSCSELGIVSEIIIMSSGSIVFVMSGRLG